VTTVTYDEGITAALVLVCDRCGNALRAKDMPVKNLSLVWQAAIDIGWVGSDWTRGPHYCPACTDPDIPQVT
jgi:hypothetical protein